MLRLTPDTRHHIYLYAGMGHRRQFPGKTVPRLYNLGGRSAVDRFTGVPGPEPFYGLLLSCRTIYTEASAVLYSANWFLVVFNPSQSLAPLRALSPHAAASLTNLKIVLNETSCHDSREGYYDGYRECCDSRTNSGHRCGQAWHQGRHDAPLGETSDTLAKVVVDEWHATAAYLALHVVPGQLELSLVCDVGYGEVETARRVLDALRLLPRLKDCHLRLAASPEPPLRDLAQDVVNQMCGTRSPPPQRSTNGPSLMDLPCELRLRILEYTDLVTPYSEVLWSRARGGYYVQRGPCYLFPEQDLCRSEFHDGCQFSGCYRRLWPEPSIGCFCHRDHTAASSLCRCWAPPAPLFLVCRALRWDAAAVFFSKNTFNVIDGPHANPFMPWPPGDYPHDTFAASHFLRHMVPAPCLGQLRDLNLVFAPFNHISKPSFGHPALRDWAETVEWATDKLSLPVLKLRLVLPGNGPICPEGGDRMTQAKGRETLAAYQAIAAPLRCWGAENERGLARFCSDLAWPMRWAKSHSPKTWHWVQARDQELNTRVEQFVLGEARAYGFHRCYSVGPPGGWRRWSWTWISLRRQAYGLVGLEDVAHGVVYRSSQ